MRDPVRLLLAFLSVAVTCSCDVRSRELPLPPPLPAQLSPSPVSPVPVVPPVPPPSAAPSAPVQGASSPAKGEGEVVAHGTELYSAPMEDSGGESMIVFNPLERDAIVALIDAKLGRTARVVYVSAGQRTRLDGLRPSDYRVQYMTGSGGVDRSRMMFRTNPTVAEWKDIYQMKSTAGVPAEEKKVNLFMISQVAVPGSAVSAKESK